KRGNEARTTMEDDQQFCLRWNNHQSTLIQNFDTLLESGTLVDCTLAAEGKTLKAHKVVLSACSPYFECLLSEHYDKHPVFILKDVKFKELKAMMDYMYRGEVNISQDQLAALLKAAESLQIKGLSESKTAGSSKTESRPQKTVSQPTAPSLDIPHASSGLTIEKNKVPRQSLAQSSVGDIPEDTASPQVSKGLSSREGSQSPTSRKRKRFRRRSLTEDSTIENQDASNSSDMPQQMGVPALGIAPVADEKVHADPTDSLGRSALMTQLTKPADEMLQLPLEKPEPNDNLIEPKSEYLDDAEEGVEDLTLDEDMNDLNDIEQDNNRAGPSHDPAQHPAGMGSWHVTGDRSNAGGVVGSVAAPGTGDEVFLAAQEAAQAHRDSQEGNTKFLSVISVGWQCKFLAETTETSLLASANLRRQLHTEQQLMQPDTGRPRWLSRKSSARHAVSFVIGYKYRSGLRGHIADCLSEKEKLEADFRQRQEQRRQREQQQQVQQRLEQFTEKDVRVLYKFWKSKGGSKYPGHTVSTGVTRGFADKRGSFRASDRNPYDVKGLPLYACSQPREGDRLEWRRRRTAISLCNVRTWIQIPILSHTTLQIRVRPPRIPVYLHLHSLRQILLPTGSPQAAYPQHPRGFRSERETETLHAQVLTKMNCETYIIRKRSQNLHICFVSNMLAAYWTEYSTVHETLALQSLDWKKISEQQHRQQQQQQQQQQFSQRQQSFPQQPLQASALDSIHISEYRCCFCNSPYPTTSHLKSHLTRGCFMDPTFSVEKRRSLNKMESRNYVCPKCSQGYKNKRTLDTHLRIACGREPKFQCPYCDLKSKHPPNIYTHIRRKHKGRTVVDSCVAEYRTSVVRTYACMYCNKSFVLKRFLYAHLKKSCYWNPNSECYHAQSSKPFLCSKCGASYSKQYFLTQHMRKDCELELSANNSTRGEGTKRKYSCKYCGKGFTQSGHLRSHQKSSCYWNPRSTCHQSQKIRPFSCTQCGACYSKQSHLIFHVRHECGRTQKCNVCGKTFLHSSSLRRHRQRAPICSHRVTEKESSQVIGTRAEVSKLSQKEEQLSLKQKEKLSEKERTRAKGREEDDFINNMPSTSTAQSSSRVLEIFINDSSPQISDNESSVPWTDSKNVELNLYKCQYCGISYKKCNILKHHIMTTCLLNPNSRTMKEAGQFRCLECGRNYKELKSLRFHQKHECQKKITCPDCGTIFIGSVVPERHKKNHCKTKKQSKLKIEESQSELFEDDEFNIDSD
ncbi:LOLA2 protein, partial [Acromyrmex insinuator]